MKLSKLLNLRVIKKISRRYHFAFTVWSRIETAKSSPLQQLNRLRFRYLSSQYVYRNNSIYFESAEIAGVSKRTYKMKIGNERYFYCWNHSNYAWVVLLKFFSSNTTQQWHQIRNWSFMFFFIYEQFTRFVYSTIISIKLQKSWLYMKKLRNIFRSTSRVQTTMFLSQRNTTHASRISLCDDII